MVQLSAADIANAWLRNGGVAGRAVVMTAIGLAESSGITDAHSPTDDWGVWQINAVHFGDGVVTAQNVTDVDVNATEAIRLSSNGDNISPWATCYANINVSGWYPYLHDPEAGSAAAALIPSVQTALADAGIITAGTTDSGCGPNDVGIPAAAVANLQPGESVYLYTCPGGPFDASDLSPGYAVTWTADGRTYVVTHADAGILVPASTYVQVQRLTTVPGSGGLPGPPAPVPTTPTPPAPTLPPPVAPLPTGPGPTGSGQESMQQGWNSLSHYLNYGAAAYVDRIANARTHMGDVLT